jgi:hypothetical protein
LHLGIVNGLKTPLFVMRVTFVIARWPTGVIVIRVVMIAVRRVVMVVAPMRMIVMVMVMRMRFGVEKMRLDFEDAIKIEGVALQNRRQWHIGACRPVYRRVGIDAAYARLDFRKLFPIDEISFVENDHVCEGDLRFRLWRVVEAVSEPFGVGERNHGVETRYVLHIGVDKKGLRDRGRVGKTGRFDDDCVEFAAPTHEPFDDADQIAAHRAADAPIVHFEDFFVGADNEIVVDADFAEFVHDYSVTAPVLLAEDAVQKGRLTGS